MVILSFFMITHQDKKERHGNGRGEQASKGEQVGKAVKLCTLHSQYYMGRAATILHSIIRFRVGRSISKVPADALIRFRTQVGGGGKDE